MTTRPTTLVESDQLAQAAANVIRHEDFVPKGKRWPFSRVSKAQRDYERAVTDIAARRRQVRQEALEQKIKKERAAADAIFNEARERAQAIHREKVAEAKRPFDETEAQARAQRDAANAAANLAYQQAVESANRVYVQEAAVFDRERDAVVAEAKALHDGAYSALEAQRQADLAQISKDLSTIALEGPMRIVEDKDAWSPEERKKALIALVDMAGREDFDAAFADLCLRNVAGYVYQDRYLKPEHQQHRLMEVGLLEALVELARRTPDRRPTIVSYLYDIVQNNPGHTSPSFIKALTELYVIASTDPDSVYHPDAHQNDHIFEQMRTHIADTLKLTPRRSQVPPPANGSGARARSGTVEDTGILRRPDAADITADVDVGELLPLEAAEHPHVAADSDALVVPDSAKPEPTVAAAAEAATPNPAPKSGWVEASAAGEPEPAPKAPSKSERAPKAKRAAARPPEPPEPAAAISGIPAAPEDGRPAQREDTGS